MRQLTLIELIQSKGFITGHYAGHSRRSPNGDATFVPVKDWDESTIQKRIKQVIKSAGISNPVKTYKASREEIDAMFENSTGRRVRKVYNFRLPHLGF